MKTGATRITVGTGLIVGVGAILFGDVALARWTGVKVAPGFWALMFAALLVGCWEFFRMLRRAGRPCRPAIGLVFVALMVAVVFGETQFSPRIRPWLHDRGLEVYLLLIVGLIFATFLAEVFRIERKARDPFRALAGVGWTVLVVLTVGLLGVFLAKVRFLSPVPLEGLMYLVLVLGVVKGADIGAYAVGSTLGRHQLVPTLSPGKTVEGLIGGLVFGIGVALAVGVGWGAMAWWQMLVFGGAVSISGILGDLAESLIKRGLGVKDSGRIPGFGGVLDILDSMLAAAPVAYLLLVVLTHPAPVG